MPPPTLSVRKKYPTLNRVKQDLMEVIESRKGGGINQCLTCSVDQSVSHCGKQFLAGYVISLNQVSNQPK
jgi:hypothetical protein